MTPADTARRLERRQRLVAEAGLDGWLVADFRWNNPIFARLLGLRGGILTRRAFLWLPAFGVGEPRVLVSRVDGHAVSGLDCPTVLYRGFDDMAAALRDLVPPGGRIAMEYVERGALPAVSRADAGLVELIRSFGVSVTSSALLIASMEVWDQAQQSLHERAAREVDAARSLALDRCAGLLRRGERVTEGMLADVIRSYFSERGLEAHDGPDIAVDAHAADPHYAVEAGGEGAEVNRDSVLLIDLWAKARDIEDAPYADSTWMAYTGAAPPRDVQQAFEAVRTARDAALAAIDDAARAGRDIRGRDVDRIAVESLVTAGMADHIMHRTGHSLGTDHVHGMGTNLDDTEFPDDRPLLTGSGFTVEPAVYFPGRFGIRLEVSAILLPDRVWITTESQSDLTLLPV